MFTVDSNFASTMPPSLNEFSIVRQHRPTSCAECRRLKLRCNRIFPCNSCQHRGCASICPDGVMPTSRKNHTREQSENRVLRNRVRELENALATLQAAHNTSHRLGGGPPTQERTSEASDPLFLSEDSQENIGEIDEVTKNLGTLSVTGYGKSRFFGSGGEGALVGISTLNFHETTKEEKESPESILEPCLQDLPAEIIYISSAFLPRQTPNSITIGSWMVNNLPPLDEAFKLCETFFENGAYIFVPLRRRIFTEEIFSFFYHGKTENNVDIPRGHRLALLYMVFALGELFDIEKPARPTGGNRFYYLARAALALEPLYDQPTLTAVQALLFICVFLVNSDLSEASELAYALSAINVRLSFTLGLHRDWEKIHENVRSQPQPSEAERITHTPNPTEQEIRRVLFLTVIHFECWQCMRYGRPSQLSLDQFNFAPPGTFPERDSYMETRHMESQKWTYNFVRECIIPVINVAAAVKPPKYPEIIKLEKKLRDYPSPEVSDALIDNQLDAPASEKLSPGFRVMRFSVYSQREFLIISLHRQYFSYAMTDYSRDPLGCPFARSVLASFVASYEIVSKITLLFQQEPELSVRVYLFWVQLLIPCLVFGAIIIRCPGCELASTSLDQLDKACELLHNAREGFKPRTTLPHVIKLRDKARAVYDLHYASNRDGTTQHAIVDISKELALLGEKSRGSPYPNLSGGYSGSTTSIAGGNQSDSVSSGSVPSIPATQSAPPPISGPDALQPTNYSQWNSGDTYEAAFSESSSTALEGFHMDAGPENWTNQLFTLFSDENNFLAGFHTDMTYPDPPMNPDATQHTSWEMFMNHVLQF